MSWNNIIPWEVLTCESMCFRTYNPCAGVEYTLHERDCPIGKKLKEDNERTKDPGKSDTGQSELGKG